MSFTVPILAIILTAAIVGVLDLTRIRDRSLLFASAGLVLGLMGIGYVCSLLPAAEGFLAFLPLSGFLGRVLWSVKDQLAEKRRKLLHAQQAEEDSRAGRLLRLQARLDALGEAPLRSVWSLFLIPFVLLTLLLGVGLDLLPFIFLGALASIPPALRYMRWRIEDEEKELIAWEMRKLFPPAT